MRDDSAKRWSALRIGAPLRAEAASMAPSANRSRCGGGDSHADTKVLPLSLAEAKSIHHPETVGGAHSTTAVTEPAGVHPDAAASASRSMSTGMSRETASSMMRLERLRAGTPTTRRNAMESILRVPWEACFFSISCTRDLAADLLARVKMGTAISAPHPHPMSTPKSVSEFDTQATELTMRCIQNAPRASRANPPSMQARPLHELTNCARDPGFAAPPITRKSSGAAATTRAERRD